ncbi:MAG TPA: hydroxyacylglutathione hydrolase [Sphingomicrobium sp.]|nr:hydroxyacylglutathione hydrolase [Sphingomicrobium sp.]
MTVIATPVHNKYDHISYLLACDVTGEALALDPFDVELTLRVAADHKLSITQILSTHEHWDHAGRNEQVRGATGARVLACKWAAGMIEHLDGYLVEGDVVQVGNSLSLEVIETPGHTMTHICLLGTDGDEPFLLSGDTLFGAGVGNCNFGGHAPTLYHTVSKLLARLAPDTRIYPGHDYLRRNLEFALTLEPENPAIHELRAAIDSDVDKLRFTNVAEELAVNPFMRLESSAIRKSLSGQETSELVGEAAFLEIRTRRDAW